MLDIRTMTAADITFAVAMTDREEWGNVAADFKRLMALEPNGCFIARDDSERVGMISTTMYGDYAFMGSLIVRPDRRGRGTGTALMRRAMHYLHERKATCIELDATPDGAPLYRRLGFKDKYASLRFYRPADNNPASIDDPPSDEDKDETIRLIASIDKRLSGLDRAHVLTRLIDEFPNSAFIDPSPSPNGYAIAYPRADNRITIGPLVAADDNTAGNILDRVIDAHAAQDICIGSPETRRAMPHMTAARGFRRRPPSLRMYRGQERRYEDHIFGIISAEKG